MNPRTLISLVLPLVCSPVFAGGGVVCGPTFSYAQPRVVKQFHHQQIYRQPIHQKAVVVKKKHHDQGVIGALGAIAKQKQDYNAMIQGLQALGFANTTQVQQTYQQQPQAPYVPYAHVPYQQGTTAYSVKDVQVDAFGPQDVREMVAAVSQYSTRANSEANQIINKAADITSQVSASVQANSDAALRVATIEAETRGVEATANAVIEALKVTRPQQQTSIRVQEQGEQEHQAQVVPPAPQPSSPQEVSVALLQKNCVSCHGSNMDDPKGGFMLSRWLEDRQVESAANHVMGGTMPPESNLSLQERLALVAELQQLLRK